MVWVREDTFDAVKGSFKVLYIQAPKPAGFTWLEIFKNRTEVSHKSAEAQFCFLCQKNATAYCFYKQGKGREARYGLGCPECVYNLGITERKEIHTEERKEYRRQWYQRNKKREDAKQRARFLADPEGHREQRRQQYAKRMGTPSGRKNRKDQLHRNYLTNRAKVLEKGKRLQIESPGKYRDKYQRANKNYYSKHREAEKARVNSRRARVREVKRLESSGAANILDAISITSH